MNFTNNGWSIDGNDLSRQMNIGQVMLMNDFVANGYGLLTLDEGAGHGAREGEPQDVRILQQGCGTVGRGGRVLGAPIACIGPGTGLGECFLTTHVVGASAAWEHYTAFPSEGGHTDFAPRDPLEFELLQYLMKKFKQTHRVSVERIVSGRGLANIYEFLCQHRDYAARASPKVKAEFERADDLQGKVVAKSADDCAVCAKAMEIFVAAFGSEAGCCALKYLPFGGLYLAGGLTPKNLHHLENVKHAAGVASVEEVITRNLTGGERTSSSTCASSGLPGNRFLDAFRDKGRLSSQVLKVPVYAVMDQQLGQRGAHFIAVKLLRQGSTEQKQKGRAVAICSLATLAVAFAAGTFAAAVVILSKVKTNVR